MVSIQSRFVLPNLLITISLSKCKKALFFLCENKKASHSRFYKDKWFLDSDTSTYFTLFESSFVNMTPDNYG